MSTKNLRHLVFAPHHDDEVIGCGGTIARAIKKGDIVKVIIITKGDLSGGDKSLEDSVNNRENECLNACLRLGIEEKHVTFLRKKDRSLTYALEFVNEIIKEIIDFEANYIYFPHDEESDRDHRVVNEVVKEAIFLCKSGFLQEGKADFIKMALQYEVWTPMKKYHIVRDISDYVELKRSSISEYKSQLEQLNLVQGVLGLNSYRGMQVGVNSAEVFKV